MAKISLRAYNKEIESLIDRGQIDQALAHCRHILKTYPKHIDTYRLMAKAYIEAQRYGDASDVFQRVLSSIPDDFVSHLGMSIIREDEGNLDAAIWHMERAFEIQPANAAIQSELRRLYGRRDGIEPPKVRLTRGALARMYYKGELYQQAISELRTALSADTSRTDLQVLLAQAYYRSGQRVEAVDTCTAILKKLPYCIEANRILAEILAASDRAQDAPAYRQRAISLNPYLGQVSPRANTPDKVPDEAVWLEKLDFVSGPADADKAGQPQWAESIGVKLETPTTQQDEMPDWLNELEAITQAPSPEQPSHVPKVSPFVAAAIAEVPELAKFNDKWQEPAKPSDEELIPDWMKDAGWVPSNEPGQAAEKGFTLAETEPSASDELTPAEIPSWLRAMAPKEALEGSLDEVDGSGFPLPDAADSSALPWLDETPPGPTDTIANWLVDKKKPDTPYESTASILPGFEAPGESGSSSFGSETPDWLQELEKQTGLSEPAPAPQVSDEGLPDWLKVGAAGAVGIAAGAGLLGKDEPPTQAAEESTPLEETTSASGLTEEGMPDWLKADASGAASAGAAMGVEFLDQVQVGTPVDEVAVETNIASDQEALPWEDLVQEGATPTGEVPDWLKDLGEPGEEITSIEGEPPQVEPIRTAGPEWLAGVDDSGQGLPAEEPGISGILGVAAAGAVLDAAISTPEETQPEEWVPESFELPLQEAAAVQSETPVEESLPEWLRQASSESEAEGMPVIEDTSIPEWLRQMDESSEHPEAAELEMLRAADSISDAQAIEWFESPAEIESGGEEQDWLSRLSAEELPEVPSAELAFPEATEEAVLPDLEAESLEITPDTSLPDWLAVVAAGAAASDIARQSREDEAALTAEPEEAGVEESMPTSDELPAWLGAAALSQAHTEEPAVVEAGSEDLSWLELEEPEVVQGDTEPARISRATEIAAVTAAAETSAEQAAPEETETSLTAPEAAILASAGAGLDDDEAAFAWLESLAVRQGADEALMYTDEQRPVEPPEWVKQAALEAEMDISTAPIEVEEEQPGKPELEEQEATMPGWLMGAAAVGAAAAAATGGEPRELEPEEARFSLEEVSSTEAMAATEPPYEEHPPEVGEAVRAGASDEEMEAAFAWLESLAVRQGADEALMYTEEEHSEKPPEWILEEQATAAPESSDAVENIPLEAVQLGAAAALAVGSAAEAEITPAEEAEEAIPELPAWLADLEEEAPEPSATGVWMPPEAYAYAQVDVNQASLIELERLPGVGFVRAQALIDYRSAHGPINSLEELSAIDEFDNDVIEGLRGYLIFPEAVQAETEIPFEARQTAEELTPVETAKMAETPQEELPLEGAEGDLLSQARSEIQQANPRAAQLKYQELIQAEKLLPQVVKDLQEALYRYPVDISLWMTLGDAQMRSGHIQDALDAYTKAEELMR